MHNSSPLTTNWLKSAKDQIKKLWKHEILEGPIELVCLFRLPHPKTVKRDYPIGRYEGDLDKLMRGIMDCMTGIVYVDDVQVYKINTIKAYTEDTPSVVITVTNKED